MRYGFQPDDERIAEREALIADLRAIRKRIVESGERLMGWDEIAEEVGRLRGRDTPMPIGTGPIFDRIVTKMPENLDELEALITERILMYHRQLEMDGRLIPDERPKYGHAGLPGHLGQSGLQTK